MHHLLLAVRLLVCLNKFKVPAAALNPNVRRPVVELPVTVRNDCDGLFSNQVIYTGHLETTLHDLDSCSDLLYCGLRRVCIGLACGVGLLFVSLPLWFEGMLRAVLLLCLFSFALLVDRHSIS